MSNQVLVETSARHLHLSQKDLEILFGEGYQLTSKKALSQPGQFACVERVDVVGVDAPIRESGDIAGSGACKLVGPKGEIELKEGVIAAKRHIHMTPADAEAFDVKDGQTVSVRIDSDGRALTFGDVVIRVRADFALAMHIDTDESNAACAVPGTMGEVIK